MEVMFSALSGAASNNKTLWSSNVFSRPCGKDAKADDKIALSLNKTDKTRTRIDDC